MAVRSLRPRGEATLLKGACDGCRDSRRTRPLGLLARPAAQQAGAWGGGGTVLVFVFFAVVAGNSGLFSAKGIINFLEVSAQLGILAAPVALLMIAGEFDLSVGSMIGFAGILIAIPAVAWGWPVWLALLFAFAVCGGRRRAQRPLGGEDRAAILHRDAGQPVHAARPDARRHPRITGRTQVSGIMSWLRTIRCTPVRRPDSAAVLSPGWPSIGLIGKRADGLPAFQGIPVSIVWWIVLTLLLHLAPHCARASATGSSPPAATPTRRAISACRWRAPRSCCSS